MTRKQLINKNITDNGYRAGRAIKGKGTEILDAEHQLIDQWGLNATNSSREEKVARLLKALDGANLDELYISRIRYESDGDGAQLTFKSENIVLGQKRFNLQALIETSFEGLEDICIKRVPQEVIGFLSLSKYKNSLESQQQLVIDLFALDGIKIHGEMDTDNYSLADDGIREFTSKNNDGDRYDGDYSMVHGDSPYVFDTKECEYVEGRPSNYNDTVADDFWSFEYDECVKTYLKEIDPEDEVAVYHRKGKDWYVAPALEETEIAISFFDEEYNEKGEITEECYYALTYHDNKELLQEFKEVLNGYREDFSVRSYINNELQIGSESDDYYHSGIVNQKLVELLYKDKGDLKEAISDSIKSWTDATIKEEFTNAYQAIIDSKVKVMDDLKVELTLTPMQMASNASAASTGKYNHLKIIKAMEKRFGYELVQTVVSENINTLAWALRKDGEEYHFDIVVVIVNDLEGEVTLREFIMSALEALVKRKIERLSQAELFEKASHVFIGIEDSLKSGNCSFGTSQFIAKHHIDTSKIGGIRGDVLLQMENSNFTMRAVSHAIASHGGVAC